MLRPKRKIRKRGFTFAYLQNPGALRRTGRSTYAGCNIELSPMALLSFSDPFCILVLGLHETGDAGKCSTGTLHIANSLISNLRLNGSEFAGPGQVLTRRFNGTRCSSVLVVAIVVVIARG